MFVLYIIIYPYRGEEHKLILAQKDKEDLCKKVKYVKDDNDIKEERLDILCIVYCNP